MFISYHSFMFFLGKFKLFNSPRRGGGLLNRQVGRVEQTLQSKLAFDQFYILY